MAIKTLINFILKNPILFIYRINKVLNDVYRAGYIATAISEGIYDLLSEAPASMKDIQNRKGYGFEQEGLEAWLDFGVAIGELDKKNDVYSLKSAFSKKLLKSDHDAWKAFFLTRVEIFYDYIIKTPALLKENRKFEFNQSYGELFARSSRTVESVLIEVIDRIIPMNGKCALLEAGCGSGVYIKRACDRNMDLTVTGLELQEIVAAYAKKNMKSWQLGDRVTIEHIDIRNFKINKKFDLITFFNLIYYFPEQERTELFRKLARFLATDGRLFITTLCQANDPSTQLMNLWSSMTKGYGPLPHPANICDRLRDAGFKEIQFERLIPTYYLFKAGKAGV